MYGKYIFVLLEIGKKPPHGSFHANFDLDMHFSWIHALLELNLLWRLIWSGCQTVKADVFSQAENCFQVCKYLLG